MNNDMIKLPEDKCPRCYKLLDAATPIDGVAVPKSGDLCVCIKCGGWNYFNEDLKLEELTIDEAASLPEDVIEQLQKATKAVLEIKKEEENSKLN